MMDWIWTLLMWVALGGIAGALARRLMPGRENLSVLGTIGLGVLGAFVGGIIAAVIPILGTDLGSPLNPFTILFSTAGAFALLAFRRFQLKKRELLGKLPAGKTEPESELFDPLKDKIDLDS